MMLMSFSAMAVVAVVWTLLGYSIAFGDDVAGLFGHPFQFFRLDGDDSVGVLAEEGVPFLVALAAVAFSAVVTTVIALLLKAVMGWRITEEDERAGIDMTRHAESGYDLVGPSASRLGRRPDTAPDASDEGETR